MAGDFIRAIVDASRTISTIVLGSVDHGQTCLESLANAYDRDPGAIGKANVTTVLVEGIREHSNPDPSDTVLVDVVVRLERHGLAIEGIENTLTSVQQNPALQKATADLGRWEDDEDVHAQVQIYNHYYEEFLDERLTVANRLWTQRLLTRTTRSASQGTRILCCGASHLANKNGLVTGMVESLGVAAAAFVVVSENYSEQLYFPERADRPGAFSGVPWISACRRG